MEEMNQILREVEEVLSGVSWTPEVSSAQTEELVRLGTRIWRGQTGSWLFVVVSFSIEDQGFPPGTFGADAVATNKATSVVIRLPRALAVKAWELARNA